MEATINRIVALSEIRGRGEVVQQVSDLLAQQIRQGGEQSITAGWLISVLDDVLAGCSAAMAELGAPVPAGAVEASDGAQG